MRWLAGLGAVAAAAGLVAGATAAAAAPISFTYDLDAYNDFLDQVATPSLVPVGHYAITLSSTVPIELFEFGYGGENESTQYFPDGSYMGGDESPFTVTEFSVFPDSEGHPFADQETGVVPPPSVFEEFYPGGQLSSYAVTQVQYTFVSLLTDVPGGVATVTLTAVPEPAAWTMMLAGLGALGVLMRRRLRPALC